MRRARPKVAGWPVLALLALLASSACGSRTGALESSLTDFTEDGGVLAPGCGDGRCATTESCTSCAVDCGLCAGCGNHACESSESCSSCPQDCGVCETCGDGFCKGSETCLSCAPDCGKCKACGDGTCTAKSEDCFSCPDDCGKCQDCGDGVCKTPETCASCSGDCGVCAVCGNDKCEGPYETCSNCHKDCGDCDTIGCMSMLTCAIGCVDASTRPPNVHVSCLGDCVSRGCPSARFMFDQAFNCFLQHIGECSTNFGCLTKKCDAQIASCVGATCTK